MKPKQIIITVIAAVLVILATVATVRSCDKVHPVEHTVYVTDTITSLQHDTVFFKETVFEKLKTTDTVYIVRDSLFVRVDSVNVEVPVSEYIFNEVFENDSSDLKIHLSLSGYNVRLDTLAYSLQYKYTTIKPPKQRHRIGFMFGVFGGVGFDPLTGKTVPAVGVGVGFGITTKKW